MFPAIGTEVLLSDYSDDLEAHIPLLSLEGTHTWFRPPPKSSSSSRATSVASVANYKTISTPEATSIISQDLEEVEVEMEWEKKYGALLMTLWAVIYFSTLLLGILLLIWGCLCARVGPKVIGGIFVGLHILICVGMVAVEAHFGEMEAEVQVEL